MKWRRKENISISQYCCLLEGHTYFTFSLQCFFLAADARSRKVDDGAAWSSCSKVFQDFFLYYRKGICISLQYFCIVSHCALHSVWSVPGVRLQRLQGTIRQEGDMTRLSCYRCSHANRSVSNSMLLLTVRTANWMISVVTWKDPQHHQLRQRSSQQQPHIRHSLSWLCSQPAAPRCPSSSLLSAANEVLALIGCVQLDWINTATVTVIM